MYKRFLASTHGTQKTLVFQGNGAPGVTRTRDILLRRQMLYPAELRAHRHQFTSKQISYATLLLGI